MEKNIICIGKITSPHGIRGEVKIQTFINNPQDILNYEEIFDADKQKYFEITKAKTFKNTYLIAKIKGIADRNEAELLRGIELYTDKHNFPKLENNEFYINDLIGLKVFEKIKEIGTVKDIHNFGAGSIIEIKLKNTGEEEMIPLNDKYVPDIDLEKGKITIIFPKYL